MECENIGFISNGTLNNVCLPSDSISSPGSSKLSFGGNDSPYSERSFDGSLGQSSVYKQLTATQSQQAALAAQAGWELTPSGQLSPTNAADHATDSNENNVIDMTQYQTSQPDTPFTGYHYPLYVRPDIDQAASKVPPTQKYTGYPQTPPQPVNRINSNAAPRQNNITNSNTTQSVTLLQGASGNSQLPPCRVCGEKASGFHYGANTCEACKGFFRRSLQRDNQYKCSSQGNCKILPGKRHACASCRFKKCISIGMSKTAIKTGRYTHEKKNRDIEEVKKLELQAKMKKEGQTMLTPDERDAELDRIIRHITSVHLQQTPHTPDFFEKLPEREAKFLEKRALQEEMFGPMKPVPRDEYRQIYQTTGIDIDGRREMITHMIPSIEKAIKKFIAFAKALPGFKDLPIDDQIALIKAARLECMVVFNAAAFDIDSKIGEFSLLEGVLIHVFDDYGRIVSREYLEMIIRVFGKIQRLELLPEETATFAGLLLLSADALLSKQARLYLESTKDLFIEIIGKLLHKNHDPLQRPWLRLVDIMSELKVINVIGMEQEESVLREFNDIQFGDVIIEFTDIKKKELERKMIPYL